MAGKGNEIKAGLIVVVSVIILGLFLVAIFGVSVGKEVNQYRVYLDYVGGITEGSLVKYRGLNVGQVKKILLPDAEHPRLGLEIELEKGTPVRMDSKAFITSIGLMAEQHVEISAGSPDAPILPPGSTIESKEVLSFARMSESMGELTEQMQTLAVRINDLFNDENRARLAAVLETAETALNQGRDPALAAITALQDMTLQLKEISQNLTAMTDTSSGSLNKILQNLEQTTQNTIRLVEEMNRTLGNFQSTMSANNRNVHEIMDNFQIVSQNFEEFSRAIKEQPWLLIRKAAPPERKVR